MRAVLLGTSVVLLFSLSAVSGFGTGYGKVAFPQTAEASAGTYGDKAGNWGEVGGVTSYDVWCGTSSNPSSSEKIAPLTADTWHDTGAAISETYYWVGAGNDAATSDFIVPDAGWRNALQPGDLLFYQGTGPIGMGIRAAEAAQIGSGLYSHVGVYLGRACGVDEVAEMLASGYVIQSLEKSIAAAAHVDVLRRRGIDAAKGSLVASRARSYEGTSYAFPQIDVLAALAGDCNCSLALLPGLLSTADLVAGGKRQMICSEMVAWAYLEANAEWAIAVSPRLSMLRFGLWSTQDRKMDYTTPNMLALSPDLFPVGRLK